MAKLLSRDAIKGRADEIAKLAANAKFDLGTNPHLPVAAGNTLRGSKTVKASYEFMRAGRKWVHDGKEHGVISTNIGDTHGSDQIDLSPTSIAAIKRLLDTGRMPYSDAFSGVSYSESAGDYSLRKAIADKHGVRPEEVFVTEGVTGALFFLAMTFAFARQVPGSCSPASNRFILSRPVYPPWVGILKLFGLRVDTVGRMTEGDSLGDWNLDELERKAALAHRGIVLQSGDNPTGKVLTERTLFTAGALTQQQILQRSGLSYLPVDDIYRENIPPALRLDYFGAAREFGIPLIYLGGIDKTLGTGYRGGHMIVYFPEQLASHRDAFLGAMGIPFAMYLGISRLTQAGMMPYFVEYDRVMQDLAKNPDVFAARSKAFYAALTGTKGPLHYRYGKPELDFYHGLGLPRGADSEEFAYALLDQHGICVVPGKPFEEIDLIRVAMMRDVLKPFNIAEVMQWFATKYFSR